MPLSGVSAGEVAAEGARSLVLFLGTIPLLTGSFVMAGKFRGELADPVLGRTIGVSYDVQRLP